MAASPHSAPGQSTPEYLALRKSYRAVVTHFKAQPGDVCGSLFENGLIPPSVCDYVSTDAIPDSSKANRLMSILMDKVETDHRVYHNFISILKNEGPWADSIVEQLEEAFKAERALAHQDRSREDSFRSQSDCSATTSANSELKSKPPASPGFICPFCKKCTVRRFFSKAGCPQAAQYESSKTESLFPYLDHKGLSNDERVLLEGRLMEDTRKMICLFAETENSIIVSLESQNTSVSHLRNFVCNLVKPFSCKEDIERLERSADLYDIFFALHPFKSFFHYEIIESIVKQFGSIEDHQLMVEYISTFSKFCERSAFEVPPNIFHNGNPKPGDKVFSIKLTKAGHASLGDVVAVRNKVADILNIDVSALQLCCISEGCVCLKFFISSHVAQKIFPLSQPSIHALSDFHVKIVETPTLSEDEDPLTCSSLVKVEKFEYFKTQLAAAVPALAASSISEQQTEEFIDSCNDGDIDELINVCLESLGIEGEAATELRAVALEEVFEGDNSFISHLVRESGINLDEQDTEVGGTALFWSSYNGHTKIVEILIECGASLSVQTKGGYTALHSACQNGHDDTVKILMRAKADLNQQTKEGVTALFLACHNGHVTTVQLLVEAGASLDVQRNDGRTALNQASYNGHHKVVDLLTKAGAAVDVQAEEGQSAFHAACQEGHDEAVKILMRANADLHLKTKEGFTALYLASGSGHVATVQLLVEAGASLDVQTNDGRTALYQASFYGHHKVVDLLTNAGAAVDVQDEEGYTALHVACQNGHDDTVKILMRAIADLNLQANEGFTALHLASSNGHVITVQLLVEAGASLDMQANDGRTALDFATQFHGADSAVVQTLINVGVKSGKQLSDSSATHLTSEKSPQQLKPTSGVGHQALVKTDGQAPKPLQQLKSSGSVQHHKPSGMSLIKLVKTGRSFVTSKLRGPKKTKGDRSNLQKSNRRSKEKTVYVPAAD